MTGVCRDITINADRSAIIEVIADLEGMAQSAGVESVEILKRNSEGRPELVRWRESYLPKVTDEFILRYSWDGDRGVSWHLTRGRVLKKENGRFTLVPTSGGSTKVIYDFEIGLTFWIADVVRNRLEASIADSGLVELKKRVESLQGDG